MDGSSKFMGGGEASLEDPQVSAGGNSLIAVAQSVQVAPQMTTEASLACGLGCCATWWRR
jgi:hypothetical protein